MSTKAQEPTDDQLRSAEAMRYRQKLRDSENDQRGAGEDDRRIERPHRSFGEVGGRDRAQRQAFRPVGACWLETKLEDLRDDTGLLSTEKLNARADELLESHPHWKAPAYSTPSQLGELTRCSWWAPAEHLGPGQHRAGTYPRVGRIPTRCCSWGATAAAISGKLEVRSQRDHRLKPSGPA